MARLNAQLLALNRGEVSARALSRVDVEKLRCAAECQVNWIPSVVGSAMLRPGLEFIGEMQFDRPGALIEFVFSRDDTAQFELTDEFMIVRIDDAPVVRPGVSATVSDGTFAGGGTWDSSSTTDGCTATITGGVATLTASARGGIARIQQGITVGGGDTGTEHALRVTVTNGPVTLRAGSAMGLQDYIPQAVLDTGVHSLVCYPAGAEINLQIESTDARAKTLSSVTIEPAGALALTTPWGAGDLAYLRTDQSGDVLFVACRDFQQRRIERRAVRGFGIAIERTGDGPFQSAPGLDMTLTPSVYEGNGTLTASRPYFQPQHVGCLFRLFSPGQVNKTTLGGNNAYTEAIRVSGIDNDRKFGVRIAGTYTGSLQIERSLVGPDSGFCPISTLSSGTTTTTDVDDSTKLNNVVAWYRVGFASGYGSGAATVYFGQLAAGATDEAPSSSQGAACGAGGRYGICRVTGWTSATQVAIEVLEPFSALTATKDWREGAWSEISDWPTSGCFHDGRLWWFGGTGWWGSGVDDYESFAQIDVFGQTLGDSGAVIGNFGSGPMDTSSWGVSALRLLIGRDQSVESGRSSSFDQPITPTAFSVKACSTDGTDRLPALRVDQRVIYVQQSHRRVFELAFNAQGMDYAPRDLTRLNLDIGKPAFTSVAAQRQPDPMLHFVRRDGQSAALLYLPAEEVECWWRIQTQGTIEWVVVKPADELEDRVYFIVRRVINGVVRRFIEKLALRDDCTGGAQNHQLDSFVTYSGAAATTITAAHLPNTAVRIWADGADLGTVTTNGSGVATLPGGASASDIVMGLAGEVVTATSDTLAGSLAVPAQYEDCPCEVFADIGGTGEPAYVGALTVSGGAVTLPQGRTAYTIIACLGYVAPFMSAKLAYGAQGSALTMKKKIDHLGLVLYDANLKALKVGQRFDVLDPLPGIQFGAALDESVVLPSFDVEPSEAPGEWSTDSRLCLLAQAPNPITIGALVIGMVTNEK